MLVLSQYAEDHYAMKLLADGAEGVGYLLKDRVGDLDRFSEAIRRVAEGGSALDPEVVSRMVGRKQDDPLAELSPREREVLQLMAEGLSNKAISAQIHVTERMVERHITAVLSKLRIPATGAEHRRVLAVLAYLGG